MEGVSLRGGNGVPFSVKYESAVEISVSKTLRAWEGMKCSKPEE
jgi:hypothetical protein